MTQMEITQYEGGIPYKMMVNVPPASFMKFLDSLPCSCGGEAHDECRPCSECGDTPALNSDTNPEDDNVYCDECWEALVIAEEAAYNAARAEEEMDRIAFLMEDEAEQRFDAWWQRQKEEGWDNE